MSRKGRQVQPQLILIDELCPGEECVWRSQVDLKKEQLKQSKPLPPVSIVNIKGRKHVRDGAHRVLAIIEYSEENNLIPKIEYECYDGRIHPEYPKVCERLFKDYGKGISAFKAIPPIDELTVGL